jgi:hypothetical protein
MFGDFMSLLQDLIPEVISNQKFHSTWVRFSAVMKVWTEIKDSIDNTKHEYRCASSIMGHTTFQSTCDGLPE